MDGFQIIGWGILAVFYGSYYTKMLLQKRNGIKTDQMARGNKPKKTQIIEVILKTVTFCEAAMQIISLLFIQKFSLLLTGDLIRYIGVFISIAGIIVFIFAMSTMKDSWRAGIDNEQKTRLITSGIYQYSRNPAFVGFDLFYIGFTFMFSNVFVIIISFVAVIMFHLQILEEEKFLTAVFGETYLEYKKGVRRYF